MQFYRRLKKRCKPFAERISTDFYGWMEFRGFSVTFAAD
jgi:hypothetical protein